MLPQNTLGGNSKGRQKEKATSEWWADNVDATVFGESDAKVKQKSASAWDDAPSGDGKAKQGSEWDLSVGAKAKQHST